MPLPFSALSPSRRRPDAIACTAFRLELSCRATASRSRRYSMTASRAFGLRLSTGLTFEATKVGIVSQNSAGRSSIARTPIRSGGGVSADAARSSFTQVEACSLGVNSHTKTARLSPRRRSSQWAEGLSGRATRGAAELPDGEVVLLGVALLRRGVVPAVADGAGGDVVVAAGFVAARRHSSGNAGGIGGALGQSGRRNRTNAQDNSSNSGSKTNVHGTIHLGLRGLRRMAAGRDLFSDVDLGPSQPERRAVWHPRIKPAFRVQEHDA
jgi:hypothetical protein